MEMFNEKIRRIANLRAYGERIDDIAIAVDTFGTELRLLIVAADMFLAYIPFDMPERTEPTSPISGEFTAR
jgi:hypothetical protein